MWPLLLLLGVCLLRWTQGIEIERGSYSFNISDEIQLNKTLMNVKCIKYSSDIPHSCINDSTLDLSGLGLNRIEDKVFDDLSGVKNLNLENNKLKRVPQQFLSSMTKLAALSLAKNEIREFDYDFTGLNNLEYINLTNNPTKCLTNPQLLNLPKSATIEMNLQRIIIDDGSDKRGMYPSFHEGPWAFNSTAYQQSSPIQERFESFRIKKCMSPNGLLESISVLTEQESLGNCESGRVTADERTVYLGGFALKKFQRGWYNISNNYVSELYFHSNFISEIAPELFNDLHESVVYVDLTNNKIRTIPKNVIDNTYLKKMKLFSNRISTIENGAFDKTNLYVLDIGQNALKSLDFVKTMTSIKVLKLSMNQITEIPRDSLVNLTALKHLDLSKNRLTHLSADTFRGCKELQKIDLTGNLLEVIESGTFNQETISEILLTSNRIRKLEGGSFTGLKMLQSLLLGDNKLREISADTFSAMKNSVMYELILSLNEIETIEEGSFANISSAYLYLIGNKLSEKSVAKGAFESCTVGWLSMDSNSFASNNGDSFYGIKVYNSISLINNKIESIEKGDMQYYGCPGMISLQRNPIRRIENGALYELRECQNTKIFFSTGVKAIKGGFLDHVSSK